MEVVTPGKLSWEVWEVVMGSCPTKVVMRFSLYSLEKLSHAHRKYVRGPVQPKVLMVRSRPKLSSKHFPGEVISFREKPPVSTKKIDIFVRQWFLRKAAYVVMPSGNPIEAYNLHIWLFHDPCDSIPICFDFVTIIDSTEMRKTPFSFERQGLNCAQILICIPGGLLTFAPKRHSIPHPSKGP